MRHPRNLNNVCKWIELLRQQRELLHRLSVKERMRENQQKN